MNHFTRKSQSNPFFRRVLAKQFPALLVCLTLIGAQGCCPAFAAAPGQTEAAADPTADFSDAADLHVGDSIPAEVKISDPCRWFRFVPETTGMYYFFTDGTTGDAYGELFDDKAVLLAECDDIVEGVNRNFGFVYPCQAGKTYYLRARRDRRDCGGDHSSGR